MAFLPKRAGVGQRLKKARLSLGLTQKALAELSSIPLPSYKDYEAGNRIPGGDAIGSLIESGINANWLLTGEGEPLLSPKQQSSLTSMPSVTHELNLGVLRRILIATEEKFKGSSISAEKKAGLIALLYLYFSKETFNDQAFDQYFALLVSLSDAGA